MGNGMINGIFLFDIVKFGVLICIFRGIFIRGVF